MTGLLLAVQAAVFGLWAVLMFRNLFRLRRRAIETSGRAFPGPVTTLIQFRDFLRLPEFRRDRRLLAAVTLLMFALIALNAWLPRG